MAKLRRLALTLGLVLALAFTSAAEGCGKQTPLVGGDPSKGCGVKLDAPKVEVLGKKVTVYASAEAACDPSPETHKMHVILEHRTNKNGQWVQMSAGIGNPYGVCEDVPRPGRNVTCEWRIFDCEDGEWRTRVQVSGQGPFGTNGQAKPFFFEAPEKPSATIKCPRDKR